MTAAPGGPTLDHDHSQAGHRHAHRHVHQHVHQGPAQESHAHPHHGHSHAPLAPHPPSRLTPSLLRVSLGGRLGVAGIACAILWGAVWLAMR